MIKIVMMKRVMRDSFFFNFIYLLFIILMVRYGRRNGGYSLGVL